jgi:hypothetical protein
MRSLAPGGASRCRTVAGARKDDPERHLRLLQRGQPDQAQDASVRQLADDGKLAEVLVERHEDTGLGEGAGKDLLVARVGLPVARPDDVMAGGTQPTEGAAPNAGVAEELHVPVGTRKGSTRSCPTNRFA